MKTCNKCKIVKEYSEFNKRKALKDGHRSRCRVCSAEDHQLRKVNQAKKPSTEKSRAAKRAKYHARKAKGIKRTELQKEKERIYHQNNKEAIAKNKQIWKQENREAHLQYRREYEQKRRENDSLYRIKCGIRNRIGSFIRQVDSSANTQDILGLSFNEVYHYLISTAFKNYGSYIDLPGIYHIDHVIPISSAKSKEEVLALNHYSNLQLLYIEDNLKKSDSV